MNDPQYLLQNASIAEKFGYKWYWRTDGSYHNGIEWVFRWKLCLALPPEEGIGKAWIGRAGETVQASDVSIERAKTTLDFEYYGPNYARCANIAKEISKYLLTGMHHSTSEGQEKITQIVEKFL